MSSGSFTSSKYESDLGTVHFINLQPETLAATFDGTANAAVNDNIDSPFAAEVNRGAREYGLRPRYVTVAFEDAPPTGYRPYTTLRIPVLDSTVFDGIAIDDAVAYAGGTGVVRRKSPESIIPGTSVITTDAPAEPTT